MNWILDIHSYVANRIPDEDFTSGGGKVYVVLVHGGSKAEYSASFKSEAAKRREEPIPNLTMIDETSNLRTELQSPLTGRQQDNTYHCQYFFFFSALLTSML